MAKPVDNEVLKNELTPEQYESFEKTLEGSGEEEAFKNLPYLGAEYNEGECVCQVNKRIKELRIENGLTQNDVANALDISQKEYWRYEQIGYNPNILRLAFLALFYNVSLDWISGFNEEKKPFIPNTPIYEANEINGYSLKDMKAAKARGEKYHPRVRKFDKENGSEEGDKKTD